MAIATITLTDNGDDTLNVRVDFGDGLEETSTAHNVATLCMRAIEDFITPDPDTDIVEVVL